ncbi:MAG: GlxA family transcriptional regulator [Thiothrix sp.]|nr:MAG: GlxA family transcriptional regulator [Thiothrix sp.]
MLQTIKASNTHHVSFLLLPGFALTSFSLAIEALGVANRLNGSSLYDFHLYSAANELAATTVRSSNGVPIQVEAHFSQLDSTDLVVLCAYEGASVCSNKALFAALRKFKRAGSQIAALTSASFLLARAGLLDGQRCTLFTEDIPVFRELYPQIAIQENIYTIGQNIFTCAGGMTSLDMMLYIVGKDLGTEFAGKVAYQFYHNKIRSADEMQSSQRYLELRMQSPCLGAAIEFMEKHIEQPYPIQTVAEKVGASVRSLEQAFKTHTHTTPVQYYLQLRLAQAKTMIEETQLPFSTIAQATGFSSQSYFTKRFRALYAFSPSELRNAKLL